MKTLSIIILFFLSFEALSFNYESHLLTGIIEPENRIIIGNQTEGLLTKSTQVGQELKKSSTIATLDTTILDKKIALVQTRAKLQNTKVQYLSRKHNLELKRMETGHSNQDQVSTAKFDFESAQSEMKILDAEIAELLAVKETFFIKSPINGIVFENYKNPGEYAKPGDEICVIVDKSKSLITSFMPLGLIKSINDYDFFLDKNKLKLHYIHPEMDTASKVVKVQFNYIRSNNRFLGEKVNITCKKRAK